MAKLERVMIIKLMLLSYVLLTFSSQPALATSKQDQPLLKIAVVVLSDDHETRRHLENKIVNKLLANHYDASASHVFIPNIGNIRDPKLRQKLYANGIRGVLLLRPIDVSENASIKSSKDHFSALAYDSIKAFVTDERYGNFDSQAVVQVSGFILSEQQATNFWSGLVWLDEPAENRKDGLEKLAELVLFNLNAARSYIRQNMGLAPLAK